eukprot:PhM_4_TR349/c0_g1_i1/m.20058
MSAPTSSAAPTAASIVRNGGPPPSTTERPASSNAFNMSSRGRGGSRGGNGGNAGGGGGGFGSNFTEHEASLFGKGNNRGARGGGRGGGNPDAPHRGGGGAFGGQRKTQNCKHYPNCKFSDEECKFIHPKSSGAFSHMKKVCQQFKEKGTCKFGSNCMYLHDAAPPKRDATKDSHKVTDVIPEFGTASAGKSSDPQWRK